MCCSCDSKLSLCFRGKTELILSGVSLGAATSERVQRLIGCQDSRTDMTRRPRRPKTRKTSWELEFGLSRQVVLVVAADVGSGRTAAHCRNDSLP